MEIRTELPQSLEGEWALFDDAGEEIASSKEVRGAVLVVAPYFYQSQYSQTFLRTTTQGAKGREVRQQIRVSSATGKLSSEMLDKIPQPIVPKFDKTAPENKK
jgi:hypothetical protein